MDWERARQVLPDRALLLFSRMSLGDQRHALCVLAGLDRLGPVAPVLAQAALLHDVGKSVAGLTLWHRTVIVLLGWAHEPLLARLASPDPSSWRYPYHVHLRHAELGAQLCAQVGCPPEVVALVRHHSEARLPEICGSEMAEWHAALVRADDLC
ncbi:MAG: HD domain-containing protein [Anaerolineae bacterium]